MADGITPQEEPAASEADLKREWWLDRPSSINLIIGALIVACLVSVLADFFYHKHADYPFQEWIGFDAIFGFVAYVGLITAAKGFRRLLMRDEDYYD
ncbi:MAG: hypothetical protein VCB25_03005 [Myxococcota bacterium]